MKRPLLMLGCLLATCAQAQPPAIGRLFTTPQERYQIDVARGLIAPPSPDPAPAEAGEPDPPPAPVTVNGVVRRSGGKSTVWLNQQEEQQRLGKQSGVSVTLPSGRQVRIKPGQSVDMNTGAVRDVGDGSP